MFLKNMFIKINNLFFKKTIISEYEQFLLIRRNVLNIGYIKNPSEEMKLEVIKYNKQCFYLIDKPSLKVKNLVL